MTTERNDTRLSAYALGELSEEDKQRLEAELENDLGAQVELEEIEETLETLRGEFRKPNATKLDDERREAIEERSRKPRRVTSNKRLFRSAGVLALAAGGLLFVGTVARKSQTPEYTVAPAAGTPIAAPAGEVEPLTLEPPGQRPSRYEMPNEVATNERVEGAPEDDGVRHAEAPRKRPAWREEPSTERYDFVRDNPFVRVSNDPRSTFSIDVDTASYAIVRQHLLDRRTLPPRGAVRIEELVNYFDYDYPEPTNARPFAVHTEVAAAPWTPSHRLLRVGIRGKPLAQPEIPGANLVFLIDVSGSMADANKLPLLKRGLSLLAERLRGRDRVSIVVYAGSSGRVLPSTPGSDRRAILAAIDELKADGSTNGGEGIKRAYREARAGFVRGGVNRVILATDGDFNVGITNQDELVELVEREAKSGVFLSVLGFGTGNYNDAMLEKLADKGDGNYAYIDDIAEARKVLVEQATSTLVTVAKDVKIQVEWNPAEVESFRLLGYENRVLSHQAFNDDRKDAGDVGSDHRVTALYEIIPARGAGARGIDPLKYQPSRERPAADPSAELATIKLRYKEPEESASELIEVVVRDTSATRGSADFRFAAAVAEFGMLLRNSPHRGNASYDDVLALATPVAGDERRNEFLRLVRAAESLAREE